MPVDRVVEVERVVEKVVEVRVERVVELPIEIMVEKQEEIGQ